LFPVLFSLRLGGREIALHSYGVLIAAGLAAGIVLAHRRARRDGLDGGRVLDLAFWMTVAGFVGSRVVYGVVNAGDYARACFRGDDGVRTAGAVLADCTRILRVWEGGLVFYGGVAGAALVAALFARRERWSFARIGDLFAPGLALGHAFGRVGCFAAGCCFGKQSAAPWAVAFHRGSVAFDELGARGAVAPGADVTPALHPTQLYEATGELAIAAALVALTPRLRRRPGAVFLAYLALYAALRFVVEIFRGDVARRFVAEPDTPRLAAWLRLPPAEPVLLSVGQLSSLITLAIVGWAFVRMIYLRSPAAAGAARTDTRSADARPSSP
jgi:phosphatidylglycerol:prolipoprotein diacylglycerol transferase